MFESYLLIQLSQAMDGSSVRISLPTILSEKLPNFRQNTLKNLKKPPKINGWQPLSELFVSEVDEVDGYFQALSHEKSSNFRPGSNLGNSCCGVLI